MLAITKQSVGMNDFEKLFNDSNLTFHTEISIPSDKGIPKQSPKQYKVHEKIKACHK